jgi:hypothetical protein
MSDAPTAAVLSQATWPTRRGHANGVEDLSGRVRLKIGGREVGVLHVSDGEVEIVQGGEAAATVDFDSVETLLQVLGGDLHFMVATLQERARTEDGDPAFVTRIFFGLVAGSPWTGLGGSRAHP